MVWISHALLLILSSCLFFCSIKQLRSTIGYSALLILSVATGICIFSLESKDIYKEYSIIQCVSTLIVSCIYGNSISLLLEYIPSNMRIIDTIRGTQFSEQFAPELGNRDSYLETYSTIIMVALFLNTGLFQKTVTLFVETIVLIGNTNHIYELSKEFLFMHIQYFIEFSVLFMFPLILFSLLLETIFCIAQKINPKFQLGHELGISKNALSFFFLFCVFFHYEYYISFMADVHKESVPYLLR